MVTSSPAPSGPPSTRSIDRLAAALLGTALLYPGVTLGLELEVTAAGGDSDARRARLPMLVVEPGQPPTPFLEAGSFRAAWTGQLHLEKRSYLYFEFEGSAAAARLQIDGESILEAGSADEGISGARSSRLRLAPGAHPFRLEVESLPEGSVEFRLLWEGRDFAREPVPASLFTEPGLPSDTLTPSQVPTARYGRQLVAEFRCLSCHQLPETAALQMPETLVAAPSFEGIGSRLHPTWLAHWIASPEAMVPGTRMPHSLGDGDLAQQLAADDTRAIDIAAWLGSLLDADVGGEGAAVAAKGSAALGEQLYARLGCASCHSFDPTGVRSLRHAGAKYQAGALASKILDPDRHHTGARMPRFSVTDEGARDLEAFIRDRGEPLTAPDLAAGDPGRGRLAAQAVGCLHCHEATPSESDPPPLAYPGRLSWIDLDGAHWETAHRTHAGSKSEGAPYYSMTPLENDSIQTFLAEPEAWRSFERVVPAEFALRRLETLNCTTCHEFDGRSASGLNSTGHAPPPLTHAGAKLESDWLIAFLAGEREEKARPWIEMQMPAIERDSEMLATGLAHLHGHTTAAEVAAEGSGDNIEVGEQLVRGSPGFACNNCHAVGDQPALAAFEAPGISLGLSVRRLRKPFYDRWMLDPQRIQPSVKMPKFTTGPNETALFEVLEGKADRQFDAIWSYLRGVSEETTRDAP